MVTSGFVPDSPSYSNARIVVDADTVLQSVDIWRQRAPRQVLGVEDLYGIVEQHKDSVSELEFDPTTGMPLAIQATGSGGAVIVQVSNVDYRPGNAQLAHFGRDDAMLAKIEKQRLAWDAVAPETYGFIIDGRGMGFSYAEGTVDASGAVEIADVERGSAPVDSVPLTVPELFDFVEMFLTTSITRVVVTYDAELGYPDRIWHNRGGADGDSRWIYAVIDARPTASDTQGE